MKKILMISLCSVIMMNSSTFASTKSVEWYEDQLKLYDMKPLDDVEKDMIKMAKKSSNDNPEIIVNRDINAYLSVGVKYRQLILGAGKKHQKSTRNGEPIYTIDYGKEYFPDLVGSINDPKVMEKIPNDSFDSVVWENIPCSVLLNTEAFNQAYRILKQGGNVHINFPPSCARTAPILINETKFKGKLKADYGKGLTRPSEWEKIGTKEEVAKSEEWRLFEEKTAAVEIIK